VAVAKGSAGGGSSKDPAPTALPHSDGSLPVKLPKPIDGSKFAAIEAMKFDGFKVDTHAKTADMLEVRQKTEDHPRIWATINMHACHDDCWPMELAKWKEHEPTIKKLLPEVLQKAPDTVWELGSTQLNGATMIYSYQLGQHIDPQEGGSYTHAYTLYYNDGINAISVVAEYKDDWMADKEAMAKSVPREDLEHVATAFMDVYTHAW